MIRFLAVVTLVVSTLPAAATAAPTDAAATSPPRCSAKGVVQVRPGQNVRVAVAKAPTGATICFAAGRYRLTAPLLPRTGQTLIGSKAVLDGSRVLSGFRQVAGGWRVTGQRLDGERTGTCRTGSACTYPNDVLRDGTPLRRVLSRAALRAGTYFADPGHGTIYLHDSPRGHRLSVLVAPAAVVSRSARTGSDVTVRGFTVEHFATPAQRGAIQTAVSGWTISDNTVRNNHGAGITANGNVHIARNVISGNGQLGLGGNGRHTVVTGNTISGNGGGGFDPAWEAGGAKWAVTDDLRVSGNTVTGNHGPGLWIDIDALHTTFADNVVRDNDAAGIFVEISSHAVVTGNRLSGNGLHDRGWMWGAGILVAGSHHVTVSGNRLAGNGTGIALIQQDRGTSDRDGTPRTLHDLAISRNITAMDGGETGGVTDNGFTSMFTDPSITWTDNTYRGSAGALFEWNDDYLTAAQWRALGHDTGGRFD